MQKIPHLGCLLFFSGRPQRQSATFSHSITDVKLQHTAEVVSVRFLYHPVTLLLPLQIAHGVRFTPKERVMLYLPEGQQLHKSFGILLYGIFIYFYLPSLCLLCQYSLLYIHFWYVHGVCMLCVLETEIRTSCTQGKCFILGSIPSLLHI